MVYEPLLPLAEAERSRVQFNPIRHTMMRGAGPKRFHSKFKNTFTAGPKKPSSRTLKTFQVQPTRLS